MKKLISMLLMVALLLTMFTGCGKAKKGKGADVSKNVNTEKQSDYENDEDYQGEEDSDESDSEESESKESQSEENTGSDNYLEKFAFEKYEDILSTFKEFGYEYHSKNEGQDASKIAFHYISMGKENINGTETEHFKLIQFESGKEKVTETWVNSNWESVKFVDTDGKEWVDTNAAFAGAGVSMLTQLYINLCLVSNSVYESDGKVNETIYSLKGKRSESYTLESGGSVDLDIIDIDDKFTGLDRHYGTTKVGDKWMYIIMDQYSEEKDVGNKFKITHLVKR